MELTSEDFPALFRDADRTSLEGQRQYTRATGARLWAAVLAAVAAISSNFWLAGEVEVLGLVAAAFFVVALGLEVWLLADRPEKDWYDGRALAESAKTLAWRFAVGGAPFPVQEADADASLRFSEELAALREDAPDVNIVLTGADVITEKMHALRQQDAAVRREAYIRGRILDQQSWYAGKAEYNKHRAKTWKLILIALEFAGVILALVKAFGYLEVDIASVTSAAIGAGAAWLGVRQHESLARSYTFASSELWLVASRLREVDDEHAWAAEVADAEEAISREHTMWRAARLASGAAMVRRHTHRHHG
ncbi:MAG: hypothetical protein JWM31_1620 [Solirubrobacterales bacterium]|nr:hypothetical protein [Solirubrobacterales bacterium]